MKFLFAFLLFNSAFFASAQYSISGRITGTNNLPLADVQVVLQYTTHKTFSNKRGEYHLKNISPGKYSIIAFSFGLKSVTREVIISDKNVILDFLLDSLSEELKGVTITAKKESAFGVDRLKNVEGAAIYAGKKTEVIVLDDISANLATNNSREVYAKVAGLNIWESDGAGIQLGIGGRGLNPNRVSNFNTRQNGYDISADALGYPESYYSPPTEALERVEIVRGAASLQYGTQFGGFINFRFKKGPADKPAEITSRQTIGSFGLFNSFNSLGGTKGKFNYYTFFQHKQGNGWRPNSNFNVSTAHASLNFHATEKLSLTGEYTYMGYLARQPGGLTDKQFEEDPRQSIRERNWFKVDWNLAALLADYEITPSLRLNVRNFMLVANRSALGFLGLINRADPLTERDLLSDDFRNFGNETRLIYSYNILGNLSTFLIGSRYYNGFTHRRQGYANDGYGPGFYYLNPGSLEHSEYKFPSSNLAFFVENIFQLTPEFHITPGIRFEHISTNSGGYYNEEYRDLAGNIIFKQKTEDNRSSERSFFLFGLGTAYKITRFTEAYANFSQNYRSINFNDMRIVNPNFRVDPDLRDERGYSADIGFRGKGRDIFTYDVSFFLLKYNDRIGSVLRLDSNLYNLYRYRTNISDSRNYGVETFAEADILKLFDRNASSSLSLFSNISVIDARYVNSSEAAYENKKVELVPELILKTGITFRGKGFKAACQFSYTANQFTDATNAVFTSNAVNGLIPAYYIMDASAGYELKKHISLFAGVNNLTDNMYFTRRAEGYPGPGIIPSDGRSFYLTVQAKF